MLRFGRVLLKGQCSSELSVRGNGDRNFFALRSTVQLSPLVSRELVVVGRHCDLIWMKAKTKGITTGTGELEDITAVTAGELPLRRPAGFRVLRLLIGR